MEWSTSSGHLAINRSVSGKLFANFNGGKVDLLNQQLPPCRDNSERKCATKSTAAEGNRRNFRSCIYTKARNKAARIIHTRQEPVLIEVHTNTLFPAQPIAIVLFETLPLSPP